MKIQGWFQDYYVKTINNAVGTTTSLTLRSVEDHDDSTSIYISPNGNDANPGTSDDPVLTFNRAHELLTSTKTIITVIRKGYVGAMVFDAPTTEPAITGYDLIYQVELGEIATIENTTDYNSATETLGNFGYEADTDRMQYVYNPVDDIIVISVQNNNSTSTVKHFYSIDQGESWTASTTTAIGGMAAFFTAPSTPIFVTATRGTQIGLYDMQISTNGITWTNKQSYAAPSTPGNIRDIAANDKFVFYTHGNGFYRTDSMSATKPTWVTPTGLTSLTNFYDIQISDFNGYIYTVQVNATTQVKTLYRSVDGGGSFSEYADVSTIYKEIGLGFDELPSLFCSATENKIYIAQTFKLYYFTQVDSTGVASYIDITPPLVTSETIISFTEDNFGVLYVLTSTRIYLSKDKGLTWEITDYPELTSFADSQQIKNIPQINRFLCLTREYVSEYVRTWYSSILEFTTFPFHKDNIEINGFIVDTKNLGLAAHSMYNIDGTTSINTRWCEYKNAFVNIAQMYGMNAQNTIFHDSLYGFGVLKYAQLNYSLIYNIDLYAAYIVQTLNATYNTVWNCGIGFYIIYNPSLSLPTINHNIITNCGYSIINTDANNIPTAQYNVIQGLSQNIDYDSTNLTNTKAGFKNIVSLPYDFNLKNIIDGDTFTSPGVLIDGTNDAGCYDISFEYDYTDSDTIELNEKKFKITKEFIPINASNEFSLVPSSQNNLNDYLIQYTIEARDTANINEITKLKKIAQNENEMYVYPIGNGIYSITTTSYSIKKYSTYNYTNLYQIIATGSLKSALDSIYNEDKTLKGIHLRLSLINTFSSLNDHFGKIILYNPSSGELIFESLSSSTINILNSYYIRITEVMFYYIGAAVTSMGNNIYRVTCPNLVLNTVPENEQFNNYYATISQSPYGSGANGKVFINNTENTGAPSFYLYLENYYNLSINTGIYMDIYINELLMRSTKETISMAPKNDASGYVFGKKNNDFYMTKYQKEKPSIYNDTGAVIKLIESRDREYLDKE